MATLPTRKEVKIKVSILGSGTSTGVPTIGCQCSVCQSSDPKDKRTRASILITREDNKKNILIDTATELRLQALSCGLQQIDGLLYTHTHADHISGFDDLRAFFFYKKEEVDCYLHQDHLEEFKNRFSYVFKGSNYKGTIAKLKLKSFDRDPFELIGLKIEPYQLAHGANHTSMFRIGKFAYATDFKAFTPKLIAQWKGKIETMIASGVRHSPHPSHSSVEETIELFKKLGVKKGVITHLSHDVDYKKDQKNLPENISFAYDGMQIICEA